MAKMGKLNAKLSFYEQVGIVIPGATLVFGLLFFIAPLRDLLAKDGISVGQLGVFLTISYAAGHVVAAGGNLLEACMWSAFGGMPTDWVTSEKQTLLAPQQIELLSRKIETELAIEQISLTGMEIGQWRPISRQIYTKLSKEGQSGRADIFNGNYGLNRGLASSASMLCIVAATVGQYEIGIALALLTLVFLFRTYRFGVHYGRELFVAFLVMSPKAEKKPRGKTSLGS